MAMLIPVLLPHIIEATANLGIGISNAIQGDSSSVSFRIGGKVFSTRESFNFTGLPIEVRQRIIHMALNESKGLLGDLPPLHFGEALTPERMRRIANQHPLNPESENHMSTALDRYSANGYPLSSWRWMTVSAEWSVFTREVLWRELELVGNKSYSRFIRLLDRGFKTTPIRAVTFREGFEEPSEIYVILAAMKRLEKVSVLPNFPTTSNMLRTRAFPFGLQLVPSVAELVVGLPLETSTNTSSRQALSRLPLRRLTVTFHSPTMELFEELQKLQPNVELTVRYIPFQGQVDIPTLFCKPLHSYESIRLYLYLPRPRMLEEDTEDPDSTTALYLSRILSHLGSASTEDQVRYTVFKVFNWDIPGFHVVAKQIWPEKAELEASSNTPAKAWQRQTDLKLFGGLIGFRMESRKS